MLIRVFFSFLYYQGTDFGVRFGRAREVRTARYETPSQKVGRPVLCDEVKLGAPGASTASPAGTPRPLPVAVC